MSKEKKGVYKVFGKSSGGFREPKQGANRRIESAQRTVLPAKDGMSISGAKMWDIRVLCGIFGGFCIISFHYRDHK